MSESAPVSSEKRILNINVGVLGHVDSGKTSLAKALSTVASTAAFDKNPQSQERGITLDLGFSSFLAPQFPEQLRSLPYDSLQFTLVDCPGHADLIRTIIGGAQIIDMMLLVIDVNKGIQTQTAECLVIGEIMCDVLVVALNKIDMIPLEKQEKQIEKITRGLRNTFGTTKFGSELPIIPVSAKAQTSEIANENKTLGLDLLIQSLCNAVPKRNLNTEGPFLFAVDHCFAIKGQGTVLTGTILSGSVKINDNIEIPTVKQVKKVKSMQMFHRPVSIAYKGDRLGICITQFDPKQLERGFVCSPGSMSSAFAVIAKITRVRFFKSQIKTKSKFHISIGHETVMATIKLFKGGDESGFDINKEYLSVDELLPKQPKDDSSSSSSFSSSSTSSVENIFALIEFERAIFFSPSALLIGSKLDLDPNVHTNTCRLAFYGHVVQTIEDANYQLNFIPQLKIYKLKSRTGVVERMVDDYSVIGKSLFKKESVLEPFFGLKVTLSTGETGIIESGFGQSGKFIVRLKSSLSPTAVAILQAKESAGKGKKGKSTSKSNTTSTQTTTTTTTTTETESSDSTTNTLNSNIIITLTFKRYLFDSKKKMIQTDM